MENDIKVLKELYKFICVSEGIKAIALKFCKVGRGGACCSYVANKPKSISIDLNRINVGSAYALCHEVAHQICIANEGNATHNAKFKKMDGDCAGGLIVLVMLKSTTCVESIISNISTISETSLIFTGDIRLTSIA